ncbi:hypothetical protein SCOCK_10011 [Actinacidiphila cocklensis]|uniref:Uncharacterized protein n=1 Tax=Actinacidiphila cocklensis TaxID=887465 RepID=A0A9W4DZK6_9ACTN|nr:hypothetical protein SCOCK_10011 [Actinacidiphila cocklensis]
MKKPLPFALPQRIALPSVRGDLRTSHPPFDHVRRAGAARCCLLLGHQAPGLRTGTERRSRERSDGALPWPVLAIHVSDRNHPRLARDTDAAVEEARRTSRWLDRLPGVRRAGSRSAPGGGERGVFPGATVV